VVASDIPGNNHLVSDGADGRLFPPDDSSVLASILIDLIDHPEKRARFGAQAREKIVSRFSLFERMKKIESIYEAAGP